MCKVLINEKVPFGLRDASFAVLNNSKQQLEVLRARRRKLEAHLFKSSTGNFALRLGPTTSPVPCSLNYTMRNESA